MEKGTENKMIELTVKFWKQGLINFCNFKIQASDGKVNPLSFVPDNKESKIEPNATALQVTR